MTGELDGKVAIITGGARGMGAAAVRLFVQEGAKVVIADILEDVGRDLAGELGDGAAFRKSDVSKADEVEALVSFAVDQFGGLDILFSNAGVMGDPQPDFLKEDFTTFVQTMSVDLLGPLLGAGEFCR